MAPDGCDFIIRAVARRESSALAKGTQTRSSTDSPPPGRQSPRVIVLHFLIVSFWVVLITWIEK